VLKITDYADRLVDDLDTLTKWPQSFIDLEKNWIGRSEGAEFEFKLTDVKDHADGQMSVKVFTTRADTLFGVTFVAISAEMAKTWLDAGWETDVHVKEYVDKTLEEQKQENDYSVIQEKTGVFSGVYAVNPATGEKVPVWVANYVVGGVGTGALMAVPAHDERDYEFAKKYNLPIKQVVIPKTTLTGEDAPRDTAETLHRKVVDVILENKQGQFLLVIEDKKHFHFIGGGVEEGDSELESAYKETQEESGYTDIEVDKVPFSPQAVFGFRHTKQKNQDTIGFFYHAKLASDAKVACEVDEGHHEIGWFNKEEIANLITWPHHKRAWLEFLNNKEVSLFTEKGVLVNSGTFNSLTSEEAKTKIIESCGGKKVTRYKLQDWVFARQRYWGEPFPIVFDENHVSYVVADSELPVKLPDVKEYEPTGTGESPLLTIKDWVEVYGYINDDNEFVSCDKTDSRAKLFTRETNTMPQWAGSSWYYLRFIDPHNENELLSKEQEKYWQPVDVYVGGAEHATRHLIYARFWHKFLYDIGVVSTIEPFTRLESVGLILGEGGVKMSKRLGNVINPDDVIREYGSDVARMYVMFMGPFGQSSAWDSKSIQGVKKFLDRVKRLADKVEEVNEDPLIRNQSIKKIGEDIEEFKFNTAISQLMIMLNYYEDLGGITKEAFSDFLVLLAPFAPLTTEGLWQKLGNVPSVHSQVWPSYDESKILRDTVTIAIQIAGKMRGTIDISRDSEDSVVIDAVKNHDMYKKYVGESEPKKIIVVKNKIVNIVI
jgi:leucyl-tRNA synthetase